MVASWEELCADKKRRQQEAIPKDWIITPPPDDVLDVTGVPAQCGILNPLELEITETDDVDLILRNLASGRWSSVEVTTAYYKRAIVAQQVTNCLTEIFVERALARAAEVDDHLKKTGKVIGPLHGLPISLKDQLRMKGLETTMGYVSWIGKYAERDATLVTILYEAGAVPFVRTNVPQTLMWPETFNNVFGRTLNPSNRSLTSGGSSGGEGALVRMKGSPIGVGSDIGGSVRIPSGLNGVYGLRPSYHRIPYEGAANSLEGQDSIPSVLGPISISLSGVKAFTKAVIDLKPWTKDPLAVRKAWDEDAYQLVEHNRGRGLVFAILWDNGHVVPTPPIIRGLEEAKAALIAAGHRVIDWPDFDYAGFCKILGGIWSAGSEDDYQATTKAISEPILRTMDPTDPRAPPIFEITKGASAFELWQLQKAKTEYRKAHLDLWESTVKLTGSGRPVDAIISPVAPFTAVPHGANRNADYTMVFNGLDYPAAVFPVSKVDPAIDVKKPAHEFKSMADQRNYEFYDPETVKNAPISLQLVGRTLEEEAVIAMAEIVDKAVKAHKESISKL